MILHKNVRKILTVHRNKHTSMWEVPLLKNQVKEQITDTIHNILSHTTKPELSKYYNSALFISTKTSLLKEIKQGFLNTWLGLT